MRTGDPVKAGKQYVSEVGRGLGSAISPLDPFTKPAELAREREGFKEVANLLGVPKKGPWDDILGLSGDIVLDPGNLFMAGLFKTGLKGTKTGAKGIAKLADEFESGRKLLGKGEEVYDALGKMFIPGYKLPEEYKTAKQLYKDLLEYEKRKVIEQGASFAKQLPNEKDFVKVVDWIETGGKTDLDKSLVPVAREIETALTTVKKAEQARGLLKKDIEYYFPHIKKLEELSRFPQASPLTAKLGSSKQRKISGTISEINKAFGREYFEANPVVATTIRALSSKKAVTTHDFLKSVEDMFGVVGKKAKVVDGVNYVPFKPAGKLRFFPIKTEAGKTAAGVTKKVKTYLLPEEVTKDLDEMMALFKREESMNKVFKTYDKVMSLWKQSVTSFFPAFHARNAMSNVFVNWLGGVKDPIDYKKAIDIMRGGAGEIAGKNYDEVLDLAKKHGVLTQGFFDQDIGNQLVKELGQQGKVREILEFGRKAGSGVENNARMAMFVNRLEKGVDPIKAAQDVKKYLFDYSDLTVFERDVMKRILPFYTWTRKAVPLMADELIKQPIKFKAVTDLVHNLQSNDLTDEEKALIPDYIKNTFGVQVGRNEEGDPRFLAGIGLPIEALSKATMTGDTVTEMLSPLIKIPLELKTGTSFFTDKKIKEDPFFYKTTKIWKNFPILKQYLEAEETKNGWVVNPTRMYWLKSIIGRFVSTGEQITKEDREWWVKVVNTLTGMKIYDVDIETQKYFKEKEARDEALLPLEQKGEVASFERFFVPKD